MTTRLIMHGAAGRMGQRILSLALEDPERFTVVAGVDQRSGTLADLGLPSQAPLLAELPVEPGAVVIDFSAVAVTERVIAHCAKHGMHLAIGTTGLDPAVVDAALATAGTIASLWASNMSLGVSVLCALAGQVAGMLGSDYDIEIVEAHHHHKADAPSGTALSLADAITDATGRSRADLVHGREGQVGARRRGEIGMHALRMGDVVGDHSVYFVGNGERLLLGHYAHTRDIFAQGALRAASFLAEAKPGRYTMRDVLGL